MSIILRGKAWNNAIDGVEENNQKATLSYVTMRKNESEICGISYLQKNTENEPLQFFKYTKKIKKKKGKKRQKTRKAPQ